MNLSSFIWSVADLLRGKYKPHEYGKVILPFTVLRRMDCLLEPTKDVVLAAAANYEHSGTGVNPYVNNVIKGKLMESETLREQAENNSKEQFANSPDLAHELLNAIMDSSTAMSTLSKQALESDHVRSGLKEVLLGPVQLYEALRAMGERQAMSDL